MGKLKHEYCCDKMDYYVDQSLKEEHELIRYEPESRDYYLILHGKNFGMYSGIDYCPWCGKKLPKSLEKEWCKVIKEKFGLDNVFAEEWEELPKEFKTDEWWKKRGL